MSIIIIIREIVSSLSTGREPSTASVLLYKCDLCDTDYVGFTSRHLHQRVEEQSLTNNRLPRKGRARRGSGFHWKQLRDFKEVS